MTAPVSAIQSTARSRRALLAGALGGLGAWAASAIGRASPVRGAGDDGTAIVIGGTYANAQSQTTLANQANNERVLWVASNTGAGGGAGVAVTGFSADSVGVEGWSNASGVTSGVYGHSTSGTGVRGVSSTNAGLRGESGNFAGVRGSSESLYGVWGSGLQAGVYGESGSGPGVRGHASSGNGVSGSSESGTAVFAQSTNAAGFALRSQGRVSFLNRSGVAIIAAGSTSKTVTPTYGVTASSFVLLTPKTNIGGRSLWFTTNATADTFTIRMSSPRSSGTKVAWLLLG